MHTVRPDFKESRMIIGSTEVCQEGFQVNHGKVSA